MADISSEMESDNMNDELLVQHRRSTEPLSRLFNGLPSDLVETVTESEDEAD